MGIPVLILGESGSGKTYSVKNFDPAEVGIFLCEKTRLPFKKQFKTMRVKSVTDKDGRVARQSEIIVSVMKQSQAKSFVIDDSQYLMSNEFFDRVNENGYQKFMDIGSHFRNLIHTVNNDLPEDVIVYFLHHTEFDTNSGKTKAKTIGKMLDEKLTVEGCFDIVLRARTDGVDHWFTTQSDGTDTVKSPEEMFEMKIPNDLKFVDETIRQYYEIGKE